jgi:hypothetical protein
MSTQHERRERASIGRAQSRAYLQPVEPEPEEEVGRSRAQRGRSRAEPADTRYGACPLPRDARRALLARERLGREEEDDQARARGDDRRDREWQLGRMRLPGGDGEGAMERAGRGWDGEDGTGRMDG